MYLQRIRQRAVILPVIIIVLVGLGVLGWRWLYLPHDDAPGQVANAVTYKIGEDIPLDQFSTIRVEQAQISKATPDAQPPAGMDWVNVQVTFENSDEKGVAIGSYAKYLQDVSGNQYHYAETDMTKAYADVSNEKFDLPLQGPATRTGWLGFTVPRHAEGLKLFFKPVKFSDEAIVVPLNVEVN